MVLSQQPFYLIREENAFHTHPTVFSHVIGQKKEFHAHTVFDEEEGEYHGWLSWIMIQLLSKASGV